MAQQYRAQQYRALAAEPIVADTIASALEDAAERRHNLRVPLMRPVQFTLGNDLLIGELQDICETGMRLRVTRTVPLGVELNLSISLPLPEPGTSYGCRLSGRVVWQEGLLVGLEFQGCAIDQTMHVRELIERELGNLDNGRRLRDGYSA